MMSLSTAVFIIASIFVSTALAADDGVLKIKASRGDEVLLPCRGCDSKDTWVDWWVTYPTLNMRPPSMISSMGNILNGFALSGRFHLTRSEVGYCNLVVSNVRANDTGIYTCFVDGGFGQRTVTRLEVFSSPSQSLLVFAGDSLVIPCTVTDPSEQQSGVDWWFQRSVDSEPKQVASAGQVINGFRKRFVLDSTVDTQHNLVVRSSNTNDSGLYTCVAEAGFGPRQAVKVDVLIPSGSTANTSTHVSFIRGKTATLTCAINTTANIRSWRYQSTHSSTSTELSSGGHVFNAFAKRISLVMNASGTYDIIIRDVQPNDSGIYDCVEELGNGSGRRLRTVVDIRDEVPENTMAPIILDQPKHKYREITGSDNSLYTVIGVVSFLLIAAMIVVCVLVVCCGSKYYLLLSDKK